MISIIFSCFLKVFFCYFIISLNIKPSNSHLFVSQNVTLNTGETTHLKCPLIESQEENNQVTWVRKSDGHVLTNGFIKYINDSRFSPHFQNNQWILQIRNVSENDQGLYQCGVTDSQTGEMINNTTTNIWLNNQGSYIFRSDSGGIPELNPFSDACLKFKQFSTYLVEFVTNIGSITNKNGPINIMELLEMKGDIQNEKIKQILMKAEDIIKKAEDSSGNLNPTLIVNEFLPDPLPIKDFNISEDSGLTYFDGSFKNMSIHGLKQLKISKMLFNLGLIQLKVIMELPVISLQGIYEMDGKVTFFPFYGDGNFYMNVTEIEINAFGSLENREGKIAVSDIELEVYTDTIDLHMDNLMGGGMMGGITNSLVNEMSGMIFSHIKNTMLDEVSLHIKNMINIQLSHIPLDFLKKESANVFDSMLDRVKHAINESGLEPMPLPAFKDKFNYNVLVFKLNGELKISNGYLSGMSSLVRTGDIIATYNNNEVIFEARMGFTNLTGGYDWSTVVMGGGPSGSSSISISDMSCYLRLKQSLRKGEKPTISSFKIERINHLWIDVNGLGSWDFILEIIMNSVSNAFKLSLANAISGPVTDAVQKELNNFPVTFL